jgi:nucleoporin p58/p45
MVKLSKLTMTSVAAPKLHLRANPRRERAFLDNRSQLEAFLGIHSRVDRAHSGHWERRPAARSNSRAACQRLEDSLARRQQRNHQAVYLEGLLRTVNSKVEHLEEACLEIKTRLRLPRNLCSVQLELRPLAAFCKCPKRRPEEILIDEYSSGATRNTAQPQQQQQQQQQMPTLSLFGGQSTTAPPQQQSTAGATTVVQGVKVDVSNLLPTTKFESCADELKKQIETIDSFILNQIHMCNEVSDLLPTISNQGATIPNDVNYVQGQLDTMQHALENDARDIDQVRNLVTRDAAEAQVAFRAIDNLKLPLQYQTSSGGWWSVSEQQHSERQSLRSSMRNRKSTLALPDDVEEDPSTANSVNGVPANLIDYFSRRSDEMHTVVDGYKKNLKEIEDHLYGVESTLSRQINEFASSRNRDGGTGNGSTAKSQLADLAAALGDVEAGILGVASRLGGVKEEVQELILGPPTLGIGRLG